MAVKPIEIIVFSSLYPHLGEPTLGIFVENRLRNLVSDGRVKATVVAPIPWFPFGCRVFGKYGRMAMAPRKETRDGIVIYHPRYLVLPKIGMRLTPYFMFLSARRCLERLIDGGLKPDIIDAHYLYPDGVVASKLGPYFGVPYTLTARGSDVTEIGQIPGPREEIVKAVGSAGHTITVSENLRRDLIDMGTDGSKITTLRNGVELTRFRDMRTDNVSNHGQRPIILFAGWLIPRKRLDLVLKVTALISNATTVVAGDGPLRDELIEETRSMGIDQRVKFIGQVSPADMPELYSSADVLILPSDREGCANVLLEAMACGTPVVARAIGAAPDLIKDRAGGIVVDSDQPEVLARAVRQILADPPLRDDTRKFACQFDWDTTTDGQIKIFESVLPAKKPQEGHDAGGKA